MFNQHSDKSKITEPSIKLDKVAHNVIGAAIKVHRILGPGFLESVYEEALCIELELCGIPFSRQYNFDIDYKSRKVGKGRVDLLVEDVLIVELKTVESFTPLHFAQTISYLKATKKKLALLINFNVPVLKEGIKRVILS